MKLLALVVALVMGVLALAAAVVLPAPATETDDAGAGPSAGDRDAGDLGDAPAIEVSWLREGPDVVVTFVRVDTPKPLDCRWLASVNDAATGSVKGWSNFTDRQAWIGSPRCAHPDWGDPPAWVTDPNMDLTDGDGDHRLSSGDYLTVRGVAPGEETALELWMAYWGSWLYHFLWTLPVSDIGI